MFNITNYQRNANQNHNEVLPHTGQNAIIIKSTNNKRWRGCGEKETLLFCLWEYKLVQPLWKTPCSFFKKQKIEVPYDPAISLLGIYPEKTKSNLKRYMHSETQKQSKYPTTDN